MLNDDTFESKFDPCSEHFNVYTAVTIILPVMLYGCKTWSLRLREECRLRVFENRILRPIFGLKRDVNGEWRRLHNEELHSLCPSPNIVRVIKSRRLRWADQVAEWKKAGVFYKF